MYQNGIGPGNRFERVCIWYVFSRATLLRKIICALAPNARLLSLRYFARETDFSAYLKGIYTRPYLSRGKLLEHRARCIETFAYHGLSRRE